MSSYDQLIEILKNDYENIIKTLFSDVITCCNNIEPLTFNKNDDVNKIRIIIENIISKSVYFKKLRNTYDYVKNMHIDLHMPKLDEQKCFIYVLEILMCIVGGNDVDSKYIQLFYRS